MIKINKKHIIVLFIFLAVDLFIACGISELWIRLFIPVKNVCYQHDPLLGDLYCPNQKTYGYVQKDYSNILTTNSLGFHDIERQKSKKPNTLRIHFYGDSLIGGLGVPVDKTIPSQVENLVNKSQKSVRIETLNLSSPEDSTCAQFLVYQNIGKSYSPDVVICCFMGDFEDNIYETHQKARSPYFTMSSEGTLVFVPPGKVDMTTYWEQFKKASRLYRLLANKFLASKLYYNTIQIADRIRYRLITRNKSEIISNKSAIEVKNKILREKSWPLTLKLLKKFKREVENDGSIFLLVDGRSFHNNLGPGFTNKDFEKFCKENSINYIPMYEEYSSLFKSPNKASLVLKDSHPTSLGNEKLSEFLAEKLITKLPSLTKSNR